MRHKNLILCTGLTGFVVFVAGVALGWFGFPMIVHREVKNGVLLLNESEAFERWRKIPLAIQFKIYLFNVTNPDDVMQGANPIVREIGPYCYDQYREKYDIAFEENDTLSYYENSTFYFNQEMSGNSSPDDEVTFLNIGLLGSTLKVKKLYGSETLSMMAPIVRDMFVGGSESIFMTAPVKKLLWEGVTIINSTTSKFVSSMLRSQLPNTMSEPSQGIFDFSFFGYKNNSNNGRFRINRGTSDIEKLGHIQEWNDDVAVDKWLGDTCNMINGTDSTIFPPFVKSTDKIYIFVTDVCRSLNAEYEGDVKVEGVPAMRFVASRYLLADPHEYAPNLCFCDGKEDSPPEELVCLKTGALDLYRCLEVPVIMTFPHFYSASPEYLTYVEGLHPEKEKHQTFSDIEPNTGIPLRGAKRMQMNMFLTKIDELAILNNVSEGLFPIVWAEEGVQLGEEHLNKFRKLAFMLSLMDVLKWLVPAAGLLLLCYTSYKYVTSRTRGIADKVTVTYDNRGYVHRPEDLDGEMLTEKHMEKFKKFQALMCCVAVLKWLLPAIGILLMVVAVFFCSRIAAPKETKSPNKNEIRICYENKAYVPESKMLDKTEVVNKTLMMADLTELMKTPRKRLIEKFPGKCYARNSRRKTSSVGLNVTNDLDNTVSLSNVFM